jgi:hypothetical protein
MSQQHYIQLDHDDLLEIVLPSGQKINVSYGDIDEAAWPQLYVNLPERLTVNAWPDDQGKEESTVTEATQLVIPVRRRVR